MTIDRVSDITVIIIVIVDIPVPDDVTILVYQVRLIDIGNRFSRNQLNRY